MSNPEISRLFSLYAELLLLHQKDEKLAALLSGASYSFLSTFIWDLFKAILNQKIRLANSKILQKLILGITQGRSHPIAFLSLVCRLICLNHKMNA